MAVKKVMMISCGVRGSAGTCFPPFFMFIRQTDYQVSQCVYGKATGGWLVEGCPLFSVSFLPSLPRNPLSRFFSLRCPFIPSCPPWWTSLGLFGLCFHFFMSSSTLFLASCFFPLLFPPFIHIISITTTTTATTITIIIIFISEDILVGR